MTIPEVPLIWQKLFECLIFKLSSLKAQKVRYGQPCALFYNR